MVDMLEQLNYQLIHQIPEKVAWLDISVDDLLVVQVLQAQEDVAKAFPDNGNTDLDSADVDQNEQ